MTTSSGEPSAAPDRAEITEALAQWKAGQSGADQRLMDLVYPLLHSMAAARLAGEYRSALEATDLVHEAYLKLLDQQGTAWQNRNHFFAVAAMLIRRILVDQARRRTSQKRGGNLIAVTLDENLPADQPTQGDWLVLDQCLSELARLDERAAKLVELRFFAGMSLDDAAETLGIGRTTAVRKWRFARTYLRENWQAEL